jgi:EmrB/QacA subfamily drug resistance transporter
MVIFMESLDATIVNTTIPSIGQDIQVPLLQLKLVMTTYLLSLAAFIPASGALAERFGGRLVLLIALIVFILGSTFCALANTLWLLLLGRCVQGIGGALMVPVARLIFLKTIPKHQLDRFMSTVTLTALLGPALGPILGGVISELHSWRDVFWINIPFGALAIWISLKWIPALRGQGEHHRFDWWSCAFLGIALAAVLFFAGIQGEGLLNTSWALGLLALALGALAMFFYRRRHRSDLPFLQSDIFSIRTFRLSIFGNLIARLGVGGIPFLVPLLLQNVMGYSPLQAALYMLPMVFGMMTMKVFLVYLLRYFGYRALLSWNTFGVGLSLMNIGFLPYYSSPIQCLSLFFYGVFSSLQFSSLSILVYLEVPHRWMPTATSIAAVAQHCSMNLGLSAAVWGLGFLYSLGTHKIESFTWIFMVVGLFTMLSCLLFYRIPPRLGIVRQPELDK